jgi:hypothetical protein
MIRNSKHRSPRKGVVLVATMVVIVLLSLTAYHMSDNALERLKLSDSSHRLAQAKSVADSGVHYATAWVTNYNASIGAGGINDNPFHAPDVFQSVPIKTDGKTGYSGKFTLIAPVDPGTNVTGNGSPSTDNRNGLTDETGKINPNAFLLQGASGLNMLTNILMNLPNINQQTNMVSSIIDWLDYDTTALPSGQETYDEGITPRNGPLDCIEELALVNMITPAILYGNDRNRNGRYDEGVDDSSGGSDYLPGLWDYMTTYSRELLVTPQGAPMAWLNDTYANLTTGIMMNTPNLGQEAVNYVLLARQQTLSPISTGSSSTSSGTGSTTGGTTGGTTVQTQQGNLSSPPTTDLNPTGSFNNTITSIWQLVDTQITIQGKPQTSKSTSVGKNGKTTTTTTTTQTNTVYTSPFLSSGPPAPIIAMFLYTTPWGPTSGSTKGAGNASAGNNTGSSGSNSTATAWTGPTIIQQSYERPARININTCHPDVLNALFQALLMNANNSSNSSSTTSSASSTLATNLASYQTQILTSRPALGQAGAVEAVYQTPVWLLTVANIPATTLAKLDTYTTTASQVFRVQSVGVLDVAEGTAARVEAVIDTNGGLPRILAWRDMTELGNKGAK